jgi:transcriptional antiterminator RfaH
MKKFRKGWYVLYVKYNHENKTAQELGAVGLDCYVPKTKKTRQWSDRKKTIDTVLFPGYVFVRIVAQKDLNLAVYASGASSYLKFGGEYALATDSEITAIKEISGLSEDYELQLFTGSLVKGEDCVINHGHLKGVMGTVVCFSGKQKLVVRVKSLKQNLTITLPRHYLYPSAVENHSQYAL